MRIIVAIDGTSTTQPLLDALLGMGWYEETELCLVSILRDQQSTQDTQLELEGIAAELRAVLPACEITVTVRAGDPTTEIVMLATEINADMIIMGTNNRQGAERLLLGSVSQNVLTNCRCPVLIAKNQSDRLQDVQSGFHTVLIAFDDSVYSQAALTWLLKFRWHANTNFVLVSVIDAPNQQPDETALRAAQGALQQFAKKLSTSLHTGNVRTRIGYGNPNDAILNIAHESAASLVVMGSHGRTGLKKVLMGSVSSEVSRRAACSVAVVKGLARKDKTWQKTGVMSLPKQQAAPTPRREKYNSSGGGGSSTGPHIVPGGMG